MSNQNLALTIGFLALLAGTAILFQNAPQTASATGTVLTQDHVNEFAAWKLEHGKRYADADLETYRVKVYFANKAYIESTNSQNNTFELAINHFGDVTREEFIETYLGLVGAKINPTGAYEPAQTNAVIDWVKAGKVSDVKNQGNCGSCWAFAAVAALESALKVQNLPFDTYSEQQLVDCSRLQGNMGCSGGLMDAAYRWVKKGGITTDTLYPYKAVGALCQKSGGALTITGHFNPKASSCSALTDALAINPVAVAVDASNWSFYKSGFFSNCENQLNHGVLLVGLDAAGNWNIKNSWGASWGAQGFIQLAAGNTCGVCDDAVYPTGVKV